MKGEGEGKSYSHQHAGIGESGESTDNSLAKLVPWKTICSSQYLSFCKSQKKVKVKGEGEGEG
ncbi:hypothetical protein M1146_06570 [Patescibacteria group bacterium]|nr:hypothetical protein [Patescibacteria group bacterium]